MAINDIDPLDPIMPYQGTKQDQKRKKKNSDRFSLEDASGDVFEKLSYNINDAASFMGIPEAELTPNVSEAIVTLMEEVDRLRNRINEFQGFESYLSSSLDKHSDLPVLTQHALMREVRLFCSAMERSQAEGVFVYVQIHNIMEIKDRYGLLCADEAKKEMAVILKNQLRQTDIIGTLGGDGFGVLLGLSNLEQAQNKISTIIDNMTTAPFVWDGQALELEFCTGFHDLDAEDTPMDVLEKVDQDRRLKQ